MAPASTEMKGKIKEELVVFRDFLHNVAFFFIFIFLSHWLCFVHDLFLATRKVGKCSSVVMHIRPHTHKMLILLLSHMGASVTKVWMLRLTRLDKRCVGALSA